MDCSLDFVLPERLESRIPTFESGSGNKQLVSKDTLVKFGIDLLKLGAIGIIMYGAIKKIVNDPIFYTTIDFKHIGVFIADTLSLRFHSPDHLRGDYRGD